MDKRKKFLDVIRKECIGKPYIWAAQGPNAFDCSGLVLYALNRAGVILPDMAAGGLYRHYHRNKILPALARPGCLAFYSQNPDVVNHVMVVLDVWQSDGGWPLMVLCGARGGDGTVTTPEVAYGRNAFVDVCLGDYWHSHFVAMIDPFP